MKPEMRLLGLALIVASLALSGGVTMRSHAASSQALLEADQFGMTLVDSALPDSQVASQVSCEAPARAKLDAAGRRALSKRVRPLHTRGFNYGSDVLQAPKQVPASAAD